DELARRAGEALRLGERLRRSGLASPRADDADGDERGGSRHPGAPRVAEDSRRRLDRLGEAAGRELEPRARGEQVQAPGVEPALAAELEPRLEVGTGEVEPAVPQVPHDEVAEDPAGVVLEAVLLREHERPLQLLLTAAGTPLE